MPLKEKRSEYNHQEELHRMGKEKTLTGHCRSREKNQSKLQHGKITKIEERSSNYLSTDAQAPSLLGLPRGGGRHHIPGGFPH